MVKVRPGVYLLKYEWERPETPAAQVVVRRVEPEWIVTEGSEWDRRQFELYLNLGVLTEKRTSP